MIVRRETDRLVVVDNQVLAVLAAGEPDANARLVERDWRANGRPRCAHVDGYRIDTDGVLTSLWVESGSERFTIRLRDGQLQWVDDTGGVHSVRDVVAACETYRPVVDATRTAISVHHEPRCRKIEKELDRVMNSPMRLNRRLRTLVLDAIDNGDSFSDIAAKCGVMKRTKTGGWCGDSSWVARRVGIRAERGRDIKWVREDILAHIARHGLDVMPVEAETE
jgi:hypothetical protein